MLQYVFSKVVFLSISGGLVILLLSFAGILTQKMLSSRWNYYIWLIAVAALLLPVSYTPFSGAAVTEQTQTAGLVQQQNGQDEAQNHDQPAATGAGTVVSQTGQSADLPAKTQALNASEPTWTMPTVPDLLRIGWILLPYLWLCGIFVLLTFKIYQRIRFLTTMKKLSCPATEFQLNRMRQTAKSIGVGRKVQLRCFYADDSPFVVGIFRPVIYIPIGMEQAEELELALRHELTHCDRWDLLYKSVVELTTVLHFFNPMIYYMQKKIEAYCEYSCDERVVRCLDTAGRKQYGMMLIDRAQAGRRKNMGGSAALFEKKYELRKRIEIIMKAQQMKKWTVMVSAFLILAMSVSCFALVGAVNAQNNTALPKSVYATDEIAYVSYSSDDNELPDNLMQITQNKNEGQASYTSFAGYTRFSASFFAMNAEAEAKMDDASLSSDQQFAVFDDPENYTDYYEVTLNQVSRKYGDGYGLEGAFTLMRNGQVVFKNQNGYLSALPPGKDRLVTERTNLAVDFQWEGKEVRFQMEFTLEEVDSDRFAQERIRAASLEKSLETKEVAFGRLLSSSIDGEPLEIDRLNASLDRSAVSGRFWANNVGTVLYNSALQDGDVNIPISHRTYVRLYEVDGCTEDTLTGTFLVRDDAVDVDSFTGVISGLNHPAGGTASLRSADGKYQASWEIVPLIQRPLSVYGTRDSQEFYTEGDEVFIGTPYEQDQFDRSDHDRLYTRIVVDENGKVLAVVPVEQQTPEYLNNLEERLKESSYSVATSWQNLIRGGKVLTAEGEVQRNMLVLQDPGTWWYKAVILPENQYDISVEN